MRGFNGLAWSGQGDEFVVARAVQQECVAEDLHYGGTGFTGKFGSDCLAIGQAALLNPHLDEFMCFQGLVSSFDDFFAEVLFADHDEGPQSMCLAAQKPVLLAGQL